VDETERKRTAQSLSIITTVGVELVYAIQASDMELDVLSHRRYDYTIKCRLRDNARARSPIQRPGSFDLNGG